MAFISKNMIEAALKEAEEKMRLNEGNPLSERYIEAKASVACFKYVLDLCNEKAIGPLFPLSQMRMAYNDAYGFGFDKKIVTFHDYMLDHYFMPADEYLNEQG